MSTKASRKPIRKALFSALSNQTRIDILMSLSRGEKNVSQLVKELGLNQPLLSHNLRKLSAAGFLHVRKDGNFRFYTMNQAFSGPFLMALDSSRKLEGGKGQDGMLALIIEQAPVTIFVMDAKGMFVFVGGDHKRRLGLSNKDLVGKSALKIFLSSNGNVRRAMDGKHATWTIEGRGRIFSVASVGYKDGKGRPGVVGVIYGGGTKASLKAR
jgi:PAS domain S-box-containing protein